MNVRCPGCGKEYSLPEESVKKFGEAFIMPCPACGGQIKVENAAGDKPPKEAATGTVLKEKIIRNIDELPPMPQVAQKARDVIEDPRSSFSDLAKVIETDQGIVTRVLKLANSPFYGVSGSVATVQHASVVLGVDTLMELLTLACSPEMLGANLDGYGLESGDLWKHSLAVAYGSQTLAKNHKPDLADDAFSAGLIHDVGKLILDRYVNERKAEFEKRVRQEAGSFLEAEKEILGFDHAEIAAEVCKKWKIPERMIKAVRYHHKPNSSGDDLLTYIIHAADCIAMMSGVGTGIDGMRYTMEDKALHLLGLTDDEIESLMVSVVEYVDNVTSEI